MQNPFYIAGKKYRIMIETSNICNARCSFCANPSMKRKKIIMDDNTFNTIIDRVVDEDIPVESFILHLNGEPMTDPELVSRIRILRRKFPAARLRFTTNFSLATPHVADELITSGLNDITISLNAARKEKYEKIMHLDYENTIKNLDYFLKKNKAEGSPIEITLSSVVSTQEEIDDFKRRYEQYADCRFIKCGEWGGT